MYIIFEYLILENFIINYIILYITKIITRTEIKIKRIILAAFLGSLYTLIFFIPALRIFTKFYSKIILSLLIVKLAFNSKNLILYRKQVLSFYIVSFIFAGSTIGIYYSLNNYITLYFEDKNLAKGFPIKFVILGIIFSAIISKTLFDYHNSKKIREDFIMNLSISYGGKIISIKALLDTGNSLKEPFTNNPVIIVEYSQLFPILSEDMNNIIKLQEKHRILNHKDIGKWKNIRLIPFQSIGQQDGLLVAFKPDYVLIDLGNNKELIRRDLIIGIYEGQLSRDLQYNALLHYETIKQEEYI